MGHESDNGPFVAYIDGQPVETACQPLRFEVGNLDETTPETELPDCSAGGVSAVAAAEAMGNMAIAMEGVKITAEVAADRIWEIIRGVELGIAVSFAKLLNPAVANRYIHAKKKRTRKKYEKEDFGVVSRGGLQMFRLNTTKTKLYKLVSEYVPMPILRRTDFTKARGRPDFRLRWTDAAAGWRCDAFLTAVLGKPKLIITKKEFDGTEISRIVYTLDMKDLAGRGMVEEFVPAEARRRSERMADHELL